MKFDAVLTGAYGSGNIGDDVLFDVVYGLLCGQTSPERIGIVSDPAEYLARRTAGSTLISTRANYAVDARLHVFGGGTQFFVFKDPTTLRRQISFALRHPLYAFQKLTRTVRREVRADHVAMVGVGMGPFEVEGERVARIVRRLRTCDFIAVRDAWSLDFCRQHGINAELAADIAFSTSFRHRLEETAKAMPQDPNGKIGFVVRDWRLGGEASSYLHKLEKVAAVLRSRGKAMDFIVFSRDGSLDRARLAEYGSLVQWDPRSQVDCEFLARLKAYDGIVTARFHGAVFGYLLDCPIIGINVDPKIRLFFERVERPGALWSHPFDEDDLLTRLDALESTAIDNREHKDQLTHSADRMLRNFEDYVGRILGP